MSHRRAVTLVLSLAPLTLISLAAAQAAATTPCASATFSGLGLANTVIASAAPVPAGPFVPPNATSSVNVPAFCRVQGVATPTSDSVIHFEVWMPAAGWNGKFDGAGNGGYGGSFSTPGGFMVNALLRGYATAGSDMGHVAAVTPGGSWALGHPEKVADWGYRATHVTAESAKAIIRAFYGAGPRLSYFTGCSDGGHEGLMEAQRFPADYDGIVAGASANFWTHQSAAWVWEEERSGLDNPASVIPPSKLPMISQAAVAACDALDGVVDGLITDPRACHFDPATLLCQRGDAPACLTAPQVEALKQIYRGPVNPRTGQQIYPGLERGGEYGWPGDQGSLGRDFFRYFVFGDPTWDYHTLDFDHNIALADAKVGAVINSTSADLRAFEARGGKLIMYHGWNDPRVNPRNSINYVERVVAQMSSGRSNDDGGEGNDALEGTREFLRLFMAPGMGHCAGGPGLNTFDTLTALEQWVERGVAPDKLIASNAGLSFPYNVETPGTGSFTRPLCPYPEEAVYAGHGSTNDAANFVCRVVTEHERDDGRRGGEQRSDD
jgi:feruloyl esterase